MIRITLNGPNVRPIARELHQYLVSHRVPHLIVQNTDTEFYESEVMYRWGGEVLTSEILRELNAAAQEIWDDWAADNQPVSQRGPRENSAPLTPKPKNLYSDAVVEIERLNRELIKAQCWNDILSSHNAGRTAPNTFCGVPISEASDIVLDHKRNEG